MKVTSIEVNDFRAFPTVENFDLKDGRNLLLFGANGSGKSSLYRAVREFFNHTPRHEFTYYRHLFSNPLGTAGYVRVKFAGDANPVTWAFGGQRPTSDDRVSQGAHRLGCLDYRSLLETNLVFGEDEVNLFDLLVKRVLRSWLVDVVDPTNPRKARLGTLWDETTAQRIEAPKPRIASAVQRAITAASVFNDTWRALQVRLQDRSNAILRKLVDPSLQMSLSFSGLSYNKGRRDFDGQTIVLNATLNGVVLDRPQLVLNEARLSAIALSIYFASLLESIPDDPNWPRLLIMDDVLIGLDMENRIPVLDLLRDEFGGWQILLLTHDRTWFEMARIAAEPQDSWVIMELQRYRDETTGSDRPLIVAPAADNLSRAEALLRPAMPGVPQDLKGAAMYTRAAFEIKLKSFCSSRGLLVPFKANQAHLDTEEMLAAAEQYIRSRGYWGIAGRHCHRVRLCRKIVLNPLSHSGIPVVYENEVVAAIEAVRNLKFDQTPDESALQTARQLCGIADPAFDHIGAGCALRASFESALRNYCEKKNVSVPFRTKVHSLSTAMLWASIRTRADVAAIAGFVNNVEAFRGILIDELDAGLLSAMAPQDFRTVLGFLMSTAVPPPPPAPLSTVIDDL